ncbi:unnamed protein product [Hymenolepis diminuta]|uniref:IRS-type PTB domain-containing protein n=1 Tax=Hymenolepis diminuta TaxID=6216 RepID=A0A158QCT4_HYMDI|nr:unnamed protein product [Hymenolepis diminuta]
MFFGSLSGNLRGKSGDVYRLRICDTELALFKETGNDPAIHVWPWQEVGEPKSIKKEIRMPWLITEERPQLSNLLPDVLNSKKPENLNDAKRRRLSRADSIPTPIVFDAKYQYTISVFAEDSNSANKLVFQIVSVRAMALANENQPAPNAEKIAVPPQGDVAAETAAIPNAQMLPANGKTQEKKKTAATKKKKGFSLCGLNCMSRKKVADAEIDESIQPNHRPADLVQPPLPQPQAESIPASAKNSEASSQKTVKANVESPTVPQRRRSSSGSYSGVDIVMPEKAIYISLPNDLKTPTQNGGTFVLTKTPASTFNTSASLFKDSNHSPTSELLKEPQFSSIYKPQSNETTLAGNTTLSSFNATNQAKSLTQSTIPTDSNQNSFNFANRNEETPLIGLTNAEKTESADGGAQPSAKRQDSVPTPTSPIGGRTPTTPRSSIPLPRNPTKTMVGALHPPSSFHSEENLESKASNKPPESAQSEKPANNISGFAHSSPVAPTTPVANHNGISNGVSVVSPSGSPISTSPAPTPPTQTRRTSGLMGPKVVVNKPGIKVFKGGNAPSLTSSQSSIGKAGRNEGETQNTGNGVSGNSVPLITQKSEVSSPTTPLTTPAPTLPSPTTSPTVAVSPKPVSNIRPPSVTVEGLSLRGRSSIPTRSSSGPRNASYDNGSSSSTNPDSAPRSIPPPITGIRMPSRLPRQTAAKVIEKLAVDLRETGG